MLTLESVLALAPDDSSAKAARGLASAPRWPLLGADSRAVWGECQGSGVHPYQTQVDLTGPAFRCSCPSRKFPCKHGLALLMLRAQQAEAFGDAAAPPWVAQWLASRDDKAQKQDERQAARAVAQAAASQASATGTSGASGPGSDTAAAAAQREAQRWQRVTVAGQDLQRWLADQLARGLASLDDTQLQGWDTQAARLVDAQAPGLAQRLRDAAAGVRQGVDWPERTLHRLGLLQLACDGLARRTTLPDDVQADLRAVVGWPLDKADVLLQSPALDDRWTVLGSVTEERDGQLVERRVWLHGQHSGRRAWLLDHSHGGRGFDGLWPTGFSVQARLHVYPGGAQLRALCADGPALPQAPQWPRTDLDDEWNRLAQRVAACPWVTLHPLVLRRAVPLRCDGSWALQTQGRRLPLQLADADGWGLLAASGGHPLHLAGEWDGQVLNALSAWRDDDGPPVWQRSAQ